MPKSSSSKKAAPASISYFEATRDPVVITILVAPLFVFYQLGVLLSGGLRNGVDFMTDAILLGLRGALTIALDEVDDNAVLGAYIMLNALLLVVAVFTSRRLERRGGFQPVHFGYMLVESALYALVFGAAVGGLMRLFGLDALMVVDAAALQAAKGSALAKASPGVLIVQSIGAGFYEELVFRLILMSAIYAIASKVGKSQVAAAIVAVVVSSLVFSGVHHIGSLGEAFTLSAFTYRFFAGALLAAIYSVRGFAVAVYTHALYDVLVLVVLQPLS